MKKILLLLLLLPFVSFGQTSPQIFTSSGTFIVPCGVTSITVQAWGGGGGGHNTYNRGGGGGAFAQSTFNVSQGNSYVITVGQGASSGLGDNGGDSSFGSIVIAKGGNGGSNSGRGGQGSLSTGDITRSGGNGGSSSGNGGAGGGAAAGTTNTGANGSDTNNGNGSGGGVGGNGGGNGGNGGNNNNNGNDGTSPGGGGGERGENGNNSGGGGSGRVIVTYTSSFQNYCNPSFNSGVEPITNVIFAGINNTTTNIVGGSSLEVFCSPSASVVQGSTNAISVKGNTGGDYRDYFKVYIDWDQNSVFGNNANEITSIGEIENSTGIDAKTASGIITVPATAVLGSTRMRVVKVYNNNTTNPCFSGDFWGQAEDYTVNVTSPCTTYSLTSATATPTCVSSGTSTVTLSGSTTSLPAGVYTVTYNTDFPSQTGLTASMNVTIAGTGIFTATGLTSVGSRTITVTRLATSTCSFAITSNNTATVTVNPPPTASSAGPDQSKNGNSFILAANTPAVGTGTWTLVSSGSGTFSNTASPTATFTPTTPGTYVLRWTISNNCDSKIDQVVVSNKCETNLIKNGDFNQNKANWIFATSQGIEVEVYSEETYFTNSSTSLTAELDRDASLRQEVAVIPGVSYTVSFRYARRETTSAPATTGVTVKIIGGDPTDAAFTTNSKNPQIGYLTFIPTSSTIGVEFYNTLHGSTTYGTIIDDIVLLPTSQASQGVPYAVTNPKGNFNTTTACAGVAVQLGVENAPASGVTYAWTGSAGAVFSSTSIKNPTVKFTNSGLQQTATVTVTTAAGCSTSSTTYFNVGVTPTITAPAASPICSGSTYSSGAITSTGTTFDWSRAAVAGINNAAAGATGISNATGITEVLTNATSSPINVTYVLTPKSTATACAGIPYNLVITVNPKPVAPAAAVTAQPNCSELTGTIVLSGLPLTGTINQTIKGVTTSFAVSQIGGEQKIEKLAAGSYTFTVTQGSCTSVPSISVTVIAFSGAIAKWNGTDWSSTPTINDRVEFNASYSSGSTSTPKAIPNVDACSCYVKDNAKVTFNSGHTLNVINEVQVLSGSLTFENNASLVQHNEDPNINSGNIIYNRVTRPVNRYDFTYWSSPVTHIDMTLGKLSPKTFFDKYFSYNNAWMPETRASVMSKAKGYSVRAPQTTAISGDPLPFLATFEGVPNNGLITLPSLAGKQAHLLGNPYPSAIDADVFLEKNKDVLEGTLYFWTHNSPPSTATPGDKKYNYTANDYATYNRTGGLGTAAKVDPTNYASGTNFSLPNGNIAAGQGFFAPTKVAGGNVVFNNTMRISGGASGKDNAQFFKLSTNSKTTTAAAKTEKSRIWLNLTNKEGAFKQTLIGYITGATNEYDGGFDGTTYDGNQYVDFYSVNNEMNLAIQGRALPFVKKDSVALGYKSTIKGEFQISIDQIDGALATQNVFLEDKDLKVVHDLKKEAYTFSTEKGTFNNRFVLRYADKNAIDEVIVPEVPGQESNAAVIVSVKDGEIKINATATKLDKVVVYDVAGRKLFQKNKVDANMLFIPHSVWNHQVLVVDIVLTDGTKHSRKIIN